MFPYSVKVLFRPTRARRTAMVGVVALTAAGLTELVLRGLLGGDGNAQDLLLGAQAPTVTHPFGTDVLGRDELLRVLQGGRTSLGIVGGASLISVLVGLPVGALVAHLPGQRQRLSQRLLELAGALPYLILVIVLMLAVRALRTAAGEYGLPSPLLHPAVSLILSLGIGQSLVVARVVQAEMQTLLTTDFYLHVRLQGQGTLRAFTHTLLPNCAAVIVAYGVIGIPGLLFAEAFLSFLGFGLESPQLSWGMLISEGRRSMAVFPWLLAFPALFLSGLCLVTYLLGEALREQLSHFRVGVIRPAQNRDVS
ncbi:MAG: ABC transporter permease [Myxococcota bacterium]